MTSFEKNVRKALIDRDMTLSDLAEQLGISLTYLYDIFKNSRKAVHQRKRIIQILELKDD
mgnify:CR=1 FL=1|nr:helix-turn-helix transcriptional regulator [uncultured Anaerocolumna sp.]